MRHDIYTLPQITMVGGQSETIRWRLFDKNGAPYDASHVLARFALTDYSDQSSDTPALAIAATIEEDSESGAANVLRVNLASDDTSALYGKYIYQLTIKDGIDETCIPGQGIVFIAHNIDQGFLGN